MRQSEKTVLLLMHGPAKQVFEGAGLDPGVSFMFHHWERQQIRQKKGVN
jgi:hypothetical protein